MRKSFEERYPEFCRDKKIVADNPDVFDPLYDAIEEANKKECECIRCTPCQVKKDAHKKIGQALEELRKMKEEDKL
jgi:hypothetical protein